jgi:Protein of unknown function (DUF3592)
VKKRRRWRVAPEGVMFAFVAVALAGTGYAEIDDNHALQRRGVVTTATVLSKENDPRAGAEIKLRFLRQDGRPIEVTTENYQEADVGQTIQVVYDPMDPARVQATDWGYDDRTPLLVFGGGSLVALGIGLSRFWSRPPAEAGS